MYKQLENAIPFKGNKRLLWIPLGVLILLTVLVPLVIQLLTMLIPLSDPDSLINVRTVTGMSLWIFQLFIQ